jgi:hypothetical protein
MAKYEQEEFKDDETYPPERSKGGDNAHFHLCMEIGERKAYAACLDLIERRKNGRLPIAYAQCSAAIGRKDCPALAMVKQEKQEGKALFFISREKLRKFYKATEEFVAPIIAPIIKTKWNDAPKKREAPPPAPPPAPITHNPYADAINQAMRDEASSSSATISQSAVNTKGLSLLELARMRAQQQQEIR